MLKSKNLTQSSLRAELKQLGLADFVLADCLKTLNSLKKHEISVARFVLFIKIFFSSLTSELTSNYLGYAKTSEYNYL